MQILGMTIHAGVDGVTLLVAISLVPFKIFVRWLRGIKPISTTRKCGVDFLNGTAVVPFALMLGSVVSRDIFELLAQTNMAFFGIAGGIGMLFVIGELVDV
jgi:hypothetical protein